MIEVLRAWGHDLQYPLERIGGALRGMARSSRLRLGDLAAVATCKVLAGHALEADATGLDLTVPDWQARLAERHEWCPLCTWCRQCAERRPDLREWDEGHAEAVAL